MEQIVLNQYCVNNLERKFLPNLDFYPNVFLHHATVSMDNRNSEYVEGDTFSFDVIGYAVDEKAVALLCAPIFGLEIQNEFFHITVATAEGVPPKYSNELLKNAAERGTICRVNEKAFGTFHRE